MQHGGPGGVDYALLVEGCKCTHTKPVHILNRGDPHQETPDCLTTSTATVLADTEPLQWKSAYSNVQIYRP